MPTPTTITTVNGHAVTEGSISRDRSRPGWWVAQFYVDGAKRKARGRTIDEAAQARARRIAELTGTRIATPGDRTITDAMEAMFREQGNRSEGTRKNTRRAVQRIVDQMGGDVAIRRVATTDVQTVMADMATSGYRASVLTAWRKSLSPVFSWAVQHGEMDANPFALARPVSFYNAADSPAPRWLTMDDAATLTKYLAGNLSGPYVAGLLMLHAGLRIGEALGLRWEDVDLEDRTIRVRQQMDGRGGTTPTLKTKASRRTLTNLPRVLFDALAIWRDWTPAEAPLVCTATTTRRRRLDQPLAQRGVGEALRLACERAGVEDVHPHGLRHTAGSIVYEVTGSLATTARFLGHEDLVLVTRTYVHDVDPGDVGALIDARLA